MTMSSRLDAFTSVWAIDSEFRHQSGERNEPVCLCALELRTGRRLELFFDRHHDNPFEYAHALFVGYSAAAEWKTFLSLGWELPHEILDLHFEYLNQINGVWHGNVLLRKIGSGLGDAMAASGLDFLSHVEKEEERDYILSHPSYSPEGQRRILDYCWTDVNGTAQLLDKLLPDIDLEQALLRGAYTKPLAWMEHNGLPISPLYSSIQEHRDELQLQIASDIEAAHGYGVYAIESKKKPKPVFKQRDFDALIRRIGLGDVWPLTPTGSFSTNDEHAFEPMAKLHPELQPLRQARKSLKSLSLFGSAIGADGRNRTKTGSFGAVTGRNTPKTAEFILSRPHWVRNLIAPPPGRALIHADIVAAEAGIAADASGDPELLRVYNSGLDPYIEFAKAAGALAADSVRDKENRPDLEKVRNLYKVADLAIKYGIGGSTLAANLGLSLLQADRIIATHKRTYSTYWAWAESQVKQAYQVGYISTSFGWTMAVDRNTRWNTVLNFPQQAACAELLRLTLVLAAERGLGPMLCAPHHDAFYLECKEEDTEWVSATLDSCFQDAVGVVLSGRASLRLGSGTVRYPNHYCDEDGAEIWDIVEKFLEGRVKRSSVRPGRNGTTFRISLPAA
jgi:DNA polymerase I